MKTPLVSSTLIGELESITDPGALTARLFKDFGRRCAIGTSGQLTGCALIDLAVKAGVTPRVFTIDTHRLFPETYALFDALEHRYGLTIERFAPDPERLRRMIAQHGEYLFFDSKAKQEHCCHIRKVEPNQRALDSLDVWITGLRADQSAGRAGTKRIDCIDHESPDGTRRKILKVAPLINWTEEQVRDYLAANHVPVHALLSTTAPGDWRYESLGCIICTTPIGPDEPRRAGRWRWFNASTGGDPDQKECGLHLPPSGRS